MKLCIYINVDTGFQFDGDAVVKSQVKHTTIRQKVYKKYSPQNVQVNE